MQDILRDAIRWMTSTLYSVSTDTKPEEVTFASFGLDYLYARGWDGHAMQLVAACYEFYIDQKNSGVGDAAAKAAHMLRSNIVESALNTTEPGTSTVQTESTITRVVMSTKLESKPLVQ